MKRMSLLALVLLLIGSAVSAHDGSIGLYTSQAATDCDATLIPFTPSDLYLMYYRSTTGPDGITGAELRVVISDPASILITGFTENPNALTIGTIDAGIGIVFQDDCFGAGQDYVHLGTLTTFMTNPAAVGWTAQILGDPSSQTGNGLNVAICGGDKPLVPVLGGWFIGQDGACNVGVQSKTWGAVKALYNE